MSRARKDKQTGDMLSVGRLTRKLLRSRTSNGHLILELGATQFPFSFVQENGDGEAEYLSPREFTC